MKFMHQRSAVVCVCIVALVAADECDELRKKASDRYWCCHGIGEKAEEEACKPEKAINQPGCVLYESDPGLSTKCLKILIKNKGAFTLDAWTTPAEHSRISCEGWYDTKSCHPHGLLALQSCEIVQSKGGQVHVDIHGDGKGEVYTETKTEAGTLIISNVTINPKFKFEANAKHSG